MIGELREVDDITLAIAESPRLRQAIQIGTDAGCQWENLHEKDPKRLASRFEQEIRVAIVEAGEERALTTRQTHQDQF